MVGKARRVLMVGSLLGWVGCAGDGELRDGICYLPTLDCQGSCPTFEESVAEVEAQPCHIFFPGPGSVRVGTCGGFLYTASGCGYGGDERWFSADGLLVAREATNDTPIETACDGEAFGVHEGVETSCTPVAAPMP